MQQLFVPLNPGASTPLYIQLIEEIRASIDSGCMKPGTKLPSSRALAESLGLSRSTASKAYDELNRLGYIESLKRGGTYVSKVLPEIHAKNSETFEPDEENGSERAFEPLCLSGYGARILKSNRVESEDAELFEELNFSASDLGYLPLAKWQDILSRSTRARDLLARPYKSDVFGHVRLRRVLADYLFRARGIRCTEEQIVLFSGAQSALDLISRLFLDTNDFAVVENPGFPGARRSFASYGARLLPIGVDNQGLIVQSLYSLDCKPKLAYVTPSHQDPTGVPLCQSRRKELLDWAYDRETVIIEDDFDSAFTFEGNPQPALHGDDENAVVIFLSSFWKTLYPLFNIGFVVLPQRFIPVFQRGKALVERDFHFVEHEALAIFIEEGHFERHVRRNRALYARRRANLLATVNQELGTKARIVTANAGSHIVVRILTDIDEQQVLSLATSSNLPIVAMSNYFAKEEPLSGFDVPLVSMDHKADEGRKFLVPFAHIDEEKLTQAVQTFARSLPA